MIKTDYCINKNFPLRGKEYKIALVSDLHERKPDEAIEILKKEKPNVIAMVGDLFENYENEAITDSGDESRISRMICKGIRFAYCLSRGNKGKKSDIRKENSYDFLWQTVKIAPVVLSAGNHELFYTAEDLQVIKESGALLLNDDYCILDGIAYGGLTSKAMNGKLNRDFLKMFSNLPYPKVLLCHHPEYYPEIQDFDIDLILAGHCHGGQIRVFNKGLFAPGQGLFPKFAHGVYDNRLIVSSGCSNTSFIPRWRNPTEVVIIRL